MFSRVYTTPSNKYNLFFFSRKVAVCKQKEFFNDSKQLI